MLCIPGDCPALDPAELDALLDPAGGPTDANRDDGGDRRDAGGDRARVVIVPDRHGAGTNGLLLAPPDAIAPSFGPGSCERHRKLAHTRGRELPDRATGVAAAGHRHGSDLAALRERLAGERVRAPRTRAVLDQPAREDTALPIAGAG